MPESHHGRVEKHAPSKIEGSARVGSVTSSMRKVSGKK